MPDTTHSTTTGTHDRTIDWTDYWEHADESDRIDSAPARQYTLAPLLDFLETVGAPDSHADVGCGPGDTPLAVAETYTDAAVVGYDAAGPVLGANRERADERGLSNVTFEQATLPEFAPGESFDLVTCFHTLVYVEEVEAALAALYDAVEPGGHLVCTYHNRFARGQFRQIAEDPHEHLGPESPWDPERFEERFELLIEGKNLLSYDRIEDILGTRPRSIWSVVGEEDRYGAWRHNPMVYLPK